MGEVGSKGLLCSLRFWILRARVVSWQRWIREVNGAAGAIGLCKLNHVNGFPF